MHACDMTVTYLRGGLSAWYFLCLAVKFFFPKSIKSLMQPCKNFF